MRVERNLRCGFTLVQIIIVLAIVGILVSMAVPVYQSSKRSTAQTDLNNEISNLLLTQRTRAMGTNLAMMVLFDNDNQSIQPMVGSNTNCESTRIPMVYPDASDASKPLMIKLGAGSLGQSTEFSSTNNYEDMLEFSAAMLTDAGVRTESKLMICFQANGSVRIYNWGAANTELAPSAGSFSLRIWQKKSGAKLGKSLDISVTRFGSVSSVAGS